MKFLSNPELINSTRLLAAQERNIGLEILHHLREIQARRLHLELGYSSLFQFCVAELRYPEASAQQKIQALRLLTELPEVEAKIAAGTLTVTNAAQLQSFATAAQKQGIAIPSKRELVQRLENQTKRGAERILATLAPEVPKPDRIRAISENQTEIRFVASAKLIQKLEKLKALRSHINVAPTMGELLEDLADLALAKVDPERKRAARNPTSMARRPQAAAERSDSLHPGEVGTMPQGSGAPLRQVPVSKQLKRRIWRRDRGRCAYIPPIFDCFAPLITDLAL